ncbi:PREDICTED: uncharacterized protein LOC104590806 [Nelumbo nucifera]|uniref:Uncharacterized protein LOC104590806 n=1 Tax=Nelumbo nucifera TaxID=4432 RepID=A0A1U7Z3T4_NELNU|nr:PREDICTED: uncharacterized protein LOC104590806 [Nelumbo nucifera]
MVDAASGGALVNKTPEAARELISNMAENSQQFSTRTEGTIRRVNEEVFGEEDMDNELEYKAQSDREEEIDASYDTLEPEQEISTSDINRREESLRVAVERELLRQQVKSLESTLHERTRNFDTAVEEERAKAVEDFKESQQFHDLQVEYGSKSYRSGFKLCRWLVRKKFSSLNPEGVTMRDLAPESADTTEEEEPDSLEESEEDVEVVKP